MEYRDKTALTVLGEVTVKRTYYHDKECHSGFFTKGTSLDIAGMFVGSGVMEAGCRTVAGNNRTCTGLSAKPYYRPSMLSAE
jgi:hypothetical protein